MYNIATYRSLSDLQRLLQSGATVDSDAILSAVRRDCFAAERIPMIDPLLSKGVDVIFLEKWFQIPSSSALRASMVFRHAPLFEAVRLKDVEMVEF
jgi:hypothetical protein